jgi:hypothetical protein
VEFGSAVARNSVGSAKVFIIRLGFLFKPMTSPEDPSLLGRLLNELLPSDYPLASNSLSIQSAKGSSLKKKDQPFLLRLSSCFALTFTPLRRYIWLVGYRSAEFHWDLYRIPLVIRAPQQHNLHGA